MTPSTSENAYTTAVTATTPLQYRYISGNPITNCLKKDRKPNLTAKMVVQLKIR